MSPRPQKSATPTSTTTVSSSTSDPTLLAILATLERLSGEVKGLGSRLTAVEEGPVQDPRRRMKPSAAPPISMPPKPTNPTSTLRQSAKTETPPLPKTQPPPLAPEPPHRGWTTWTPLHHIGTITTMSSRTTSPLRLSPYQARQQSGLRLNPGPITNEASSTSITQRSPRQTPSRTRLHRSSTASTGRPLGDP
jgi:hypothetical protein